MRGKGALTLGVPRPLLGAGEGQPDGFGLAGPLRLDALGTVRVGGRQQADEAVAVGRPLRLIRRRAKVAQPPVNRVPVDVSGGSPRTDAELLRRRQRQCLPGFRPALAGRRVVGALAADQGRRRGPLPRRRRLLPLRVRLAGRRISRRGISTGGREVCDRQTADRGASPARGSAGAAAAGRAQQACDGDKMADEEDERVLAHDGESSGPPRPGLGRGRRRPGRGGLILAPRDGREGPWAFVAGPCESGGRPNRHESGRNIAGGRPRRKAKSVSREGRTIYNETGQILQSPSLVNSRSPRGERGRGSGVVCV